jgi:hypothetical protein
MSDDRLDHQPWPLRAAILLALGALFGLAIHFLLQESSTESPFDWSSDPGRLAGASFVAVAGVALAFTLERLRWAWSPIFALACGAVAAGLVYWNDGPQGWRFASLLFAIGVAAPLFQVVRDEGRWRLAQRPLHAHAWSNVVLWCASWLFVGIVFALTFLLGQLFGLIGIDFLKKLVEKDWFDWMLFGAALGAAVGLLRDRDRVLGMLQRVVTVVLSMLTPVLAVGLGLFLLSLPFTGLKPLWNETSATTPILLSWAIVAVIFTIATIGNAADEEPKQRVLRYGALVLALVVLPLAAIAALSTGLRIGQHGFTPDRLWAATFILIALVYGGAYWTAVARGRSAWPDRVRQTNVWLAVSLCGLAILLATPLIDFETISTRDQLARLESGNVKADEFDWRALAFDFGPSGRKALERLKRSGKTETVRRLAATALAHDSRWEVPAAGQIQQRRRELAGARILPRKTTLPPALRDQLAARYLCAKDANCGIYYEEGADWAVVLNAPSCSIAAPQGASSNGPAVVFEGPRPNDAPACRAAMQILYRDGDVWNNRPPSGAPVTKEVKQQVDQAWAKGEAEIRPVTRRQVYVGGQPVGDVFE